MILYLSYCFIIVCTLDDFVGKYNVEGSVNTWDCTQGPRGNILSCINGFGRSFLFPYNSSTNKISNSKLTKFGTCHNSGVIWEFTEGHTGAKNRAWIKSGFNFDCMVKGILYGFYTNFIEI